MSKAFSAFVNIVDCIYQFIYVAQSLHLWNSVLKPCGSGLFLVGRHNATSVSLGIIGLFNLLIPS